MANHTFYPLDLRRYQDDGKATRDDIITAVALVAFIAIMVCAGLIYRAIA